MLHGTLDWILKTKRAVSGETGEIQTEPRVDRAVLLSFLSGDEGEGSRLYVNMRVAG